MINFLKYRRLYALISASLIISGLYSLMVWRVKPSIEFTGGTIIQIQNDEFRMQNIEDAFAQRNIPVNDIQTENDTITIKTSPVDHETWEEVKSSLATVDQEKSMGAAPIEEIRFEMVGPVFGAELLRKTVIAALLAILGILGYIAFAFRDLRYGMSAVAALLHDVLIVVGAFSLLGRLYDVEVDVLFVIAVLTTMSFSVHDTIVVFDRIRESLKKESLPFDVTVNKALTETMTRSVNNSMTIVFMLLALVLLGGESIKWFVVALLIGTIAGTYSSPFVATPILYALKNKSTKTENQ